MSDTLNEILKAQRAFQEVLYRTLGHRPAIAVALPHPAFRALCTDVVPPNVMHALPLSMQAAGFVYLEDVPYTEAPADYCGAQDQHCVNHFAHAMSAKMAVSAAKGRSGWDDRKRVSDNDLRLMLREHVEKGDPVDVANFCMMLYMRGASTRSDK